MTNKPSHRRTWSLLAVGILAGLFGQLGPQLSSAQTPSSPIFAPAGNCGQAQPGARGECFSPAAVRLADGKIFVTGQHLDSSGNNPTTIAEIYDPVTEKWSTPPGSVCAICGGGNQVTATLVDPGRGRCGDNCGKVLLVGSNFATNAAFLFDPRGAGQWAPTGAMAVGHTGGTATQLADGRVLVAGGCTIASITCGSVTNTAELYDPSVGTWSPTGFMRSYRTVHTAALLDPLVGNCGDNCGKVLVVAGEAPVSQEAAMDDAYRNRNDYRWNTAELFDPAGAGGLGAWEDAPALQKGRLLHTQTGLQDGRVLVAGGASTPTGPTPADSQVFDPTIFDPTDLSKTPWSQPALMKEGRYSHTATLIASGEIVAAGGRGQNPQVPGDAILSSTELFEPPARGSAEPGVWKTGPPLIQARYYHAAAPLPQGSRGKILIVGGSEPDAAGSASPQSTAELYVAPPVVASIAPAEGPTKGGTHLILNGSGLARVSKVSFEGEPPLTCGLAGKAPCWSDSTKPDSQVHAISPAHPTEGPVQVSLTTETGITNPATWDALSPQPFVYRDIVVPSLNGLNVTCGAVSGGTEVTLAGARLSALTSVSFGDARLTDFKSKTDAVVTVLSPAHSPATVDVSVESPGLPAPVKAGQFTYPCPAQAIVDNATGAGGAALGPRTIQAPRPPAGPPGGAHSALPGHPGSPGGPSAPGSAPSGGPASVSSPVSGHSLSPSATHSASASAEAPPVSSAAPSLGTTQVFAPAPGAVAPASASVEPAPRYSMVGAQQGVLTGLFGAGLIAAVACLMLAGRRRGSTGAFARPSDAAQTRPCPKGAY